MELLLQRDASSLTCTIGSLFVDGLFECYTLEDVVRVDDPNTLPDEGEKVYGETAIPAGRYQVVLDYSTRFKCEMPHLLDVPGFAGIRIHPGNTDADTLGCILVGAIKQAEALSNSRIAYNHLFNHLVDAKNAGAKIWIDIKDAPLETQS